MKNIHTRLIFSRIGFNNLVIKPHYKKKKKKMVIFLEIALLDSPLAIQLRLAVGQKLFIFRQLGITDYLL